MKWQPIETAPIQPFDPARYYAPASPAVLVCTVEKWVLIARYRYTKKGKGSWVIEWGSRVCRPTHWMPLPEPQAIADAPSVAPQNPVPHGKPV
jgi:hypothetical protein